MKRVLSLFLTVALLITIMPAGLFSITASAATSGTCGDNLTWTLDDEGTLTISGMSLGDVVYMQFLIPPTAVNANGTMTYQVPGEKAVEVRVGDLQLYYGYYLINIPIKAKHVRSDISISFTAEDYSMTCSIEAFATAKAGTATETLVAALMAYGDAAKVVFG